tara:strand:- start:9322 stop:10749 length:1428 start_codon:yes stop_codon:yes gene_type:complete
MKIKEIKLWSVVMAGGSGSRLWPLSRSTMPKQFCSIDGENNLFYQTVERASKLGKSNPLLVVINKEYKYLAIQELDRLGVEYHLILEPEKRNTAPAIALACRYALKFDEDPRLLVLSSDHFISTEEDFISTISNVVNSMEKESIITFGSEAVTPETGYGYIHYERIGGLIHDVKKFVEKPTKHKAQEYINEGNYLWNTGIFLFSAQVMLAELKKYAREIYDVSNTVNTSIEINDTNIHDISSVLFSSFPNISIDYAVLENTEIAKVASITFDWSDMGTWPSVWKNNQQKNLDNNFCVGEVNLVDTKNSLLISKSRHISVIGLNNLVVVDTPDALLVGDMSSMDKIKDCMTNIEKENPAIISENRKVFRPWGWYDSLDKDISHQVKRIHVYPSQKLSVQRHKHRAERWIVIKGTATVTLGDKDYEYKIGEVVEIAIMQIHSLANYTQDDLEIIEVQLGDYLGEDDIERFEDIYGRS